jgi:competence protein ComEA
VPTTNPRIGPIVLVVGLVIALGAGAWYGSRGPSPVPGEPTSGVSYTTIPVTIVVHVSGAVLHPGLVVIAAEGRVADAIAGAGGADSDADLGALNLAAPLRDGDQVIVPFPGGSTPAMGAGSAGIDLNRATASELEELPGVGPVLAARIVAYRESNGPFDAVEDLLDVGGIGEAKLVGMRDTIVAP